MYVLLMQRSVRKYVLTDNTWEQLRLKQAKTSITKNSDANLINYATFSLQQEKETPYLEINHFNRNFEKVEQS